MKIVINLERGKKIIQCYGLKMCTIIIFLISTVTLYESARCLLPENSVINKSSSLFKVNRYKNG